MGAKNVPINMHNFKQINKQLHVRVKVKIKGKAVPLQARGAQRVPGS